MYFVDEVEYCCSPLLYLTRELSKHNSSESSTSLHFVQFIGFPQSQHKSPSCCIKLHRKSPRGVFIIRWEGGGVLERSYYIVMILIFPQTIFLPIPPFFLIFSYFTPFPVSFFLSLFAFRVKLTFFYHVEYMAKK